MGFPSPASKRDLEKNLSKPYNCGAELILHMLENRGQVPGSYLTMSVDYFSEYGRSEEAETLRPTAEEITTVQRIGREIYRKERRKASGRLRKIA